MANKMPIEIGTSTTKAMPINLGYTSPLSILNSGIGLISFFMNRV